MGFWRFGAPYRAGRPICGEHVGPADHFGVIPRKIIGKRRGGEPQDEREHFIQCPDCNRWIQCPDCNRWLDMRDLGDVLAHERACDGTPAPRPN